MNFELFFIPTKNQVKNFIGVGFLLFSNYRGTNNTFFNKHADVFFNYCYQ